MQYGTRVSDSVCGRCKKRLEMVVLTEAVYQDGIWLHTTCHREGTDQRFQARQLSDILKEGKEGVDRITLPLL